MMCALSSLMFRKDGLTNDSSAEVSVFWVADELARSHWLLRLLEVEVVDEEDAAAASPEVSLLSTEP